MPSNIPLAPFKVTKQEFNDGSTASESALVGATQVGGGALNIVVCNTSPVQPHTLTQVVARINAFSPYSGTLNMWAACDEPYSRQNPNVTGGCGGGYLGDETLQATFTASAGAGQSVVATQMDDGNNHGMANSYGPLPVSLAPGRSIDMVVNVQGPTAPGTYTFALGINVDNAPTVYAMSAAPILYATVTHTFTGYACRDSAMQAQIPADDMTTLYICPQQ